MDENERRLRQIDEEQPDQTIRVMGMKGVGKIDLSGADLLINEVRRHRRRGGDFHLIAVHQEVLSALDRLGLTDEFGPAHLHQNKREALRAAAASVDPEICRNRSARVLVECESKPNGTGCPDVNTVAVAHGVK